MWLGSQGKISSNEQILGHITAIRCYLALFDAELETSARYGYLALELLPENDIQTRISTATTLASALRLNGNLTEAGQILAKAISWNRKTGSSTVTIRLLCAQAALWYAQGRLDLAIESLEEAINSAKIRWSDGANFAACPGLDMPIFGWQTFWQFNIGWILPWKKSKLASN